MIFDLDVMRSFVLHRPGAPALRRLRLWIFDKYRYEEDYEKIYALVTNLGGTIE